ncbi:MAG TPA: EI24 domain-containing protein [Flavobacteriia bacterium]|jgi:CysZ protein|nr:EI24 domain-containing protein [Flavobacteriia bacterium]
MIRDIFGGIISYFEAFKIIKKLNLWKYFLIPALLGLILGIIFISTAYSLSDNIGALISKYWEFEFGKGIVQSISNFIGGISVLLIGIMLYKHTLMALSAPFMTPVSEKVEKYLNNSIREEKVKPINQLIRSIKLNSINLIMELIITIPLMILSFIPIIGVFFMGLTFYYQAYFAGVGNMDYTLERHLNYKESQQFYKKFKGVAVGNGLIFTLLLFIPFLGTIISLPLATVAATIETVEKLKETKKLS